MLARSGRPPEAIFQPKVTIPRQEPAVYTVAMEHVFADVQLAKHFILTDAVGKADRATPFLVSIGWRPKPHATKQIQVVALLSNAAVAHYLQPNLNV